VKPEGARILALLVIGVFMLTGCAGKKMKQEVNLLKTQVGGLTTELNRVSEEMRLTQETLKNEEEKRRRLEQEISGVSGSISSKGKSVTTQNGVYRTPSGFEVQVTDLQTALKNAGYYNGAVDGKAGAGTQDAIRKFQSEHGLKADGVCGRKTWGKLKSYAEGAGK